MKIQFLIISLCLSFATHASDKYLVSTQATAELVLNNALDHTDITRYEGSLLLQGMSELALVSSSDTLLHQMVDIYTRFGTRQIKGGGSFISYQAGGSGAALFGYRGVAPGIVPQVLQLAERMVNEQNRSGEGILVPGWISHEKDQVFIDMAFAVTPYLLYAGLIENNNEYIDLAIYETVELFRILRDPQTGLLHQGRGFVTKGVTSEDNWSRGNGWGALAISALVRDLPATHPRRKEIERLAGEFFINVLKYQDDNGVWHQEMTENNSFAEMSGSGLLLYGLGIALEAKIIDRKYMCNFEKGLKGLVAYIDQDGSVSNGCWSCLCPGKGSKQDYIDHVWYYNEPHAFGSVVLAMAQAIKLGITQIPVGNKPGSMIGVNTHPQTPRAYVRYVPERSGDIAWENDRIAFRVYSQTMRDKVNSGIDIWAKSVAHPVVDHWYYLNSRKLDYHKDRGEGYDFYHIGFLRGCGGTAVWHDEKLQPAEPFANYRIYRNDADGIEFELTYLPYQVAGTMMYEKKRIRMVMGTNFFQVESLFETESGQDLTVAVGLTTFGNPEVMRDPNTGLLAVTECLNGVKGPLDTAVLINPALLMRFDTVGEDEVALISVKSGQPFVYYAGAAWGSGQKSGINGQSWAKLNDLYIKR